eukprot:SAG31_NODE_3954_length_3721_cov_2.949475_3_plen_156_part_00
MSRTRCHNIKATEWPLIRAEELKVTPHGEIADIMLSDSEAEYLALYPVLLLVGDHDFSTSGSAKGGGLAARLLEALRAPTCKELLLHQYHVDGMTTAEWDALNATGKARVISPPAALASDSGYGDTVQTIPAISDDDLNAIGRKHLPVFVVNSTV